MPQRPGPRRIIQTHAAFEQRRWWLRPVEQRFVSQGAARRTIEETLAQAWALVADLPETDLRRIDPALVARYGGIRVGAPGA